MKRLDATGTPCKRRLILALGLAFGAGAAFHAPLMAQTSALDEVVVSASRAAQTRFDAPAAISVVPVDALQAMTPLVNLSELLIAVPGVQARDRQNYAQDLQISVRGFGTRSTFGVRGVRILVDGIPATMPDGQGQAATASLGAASRIEILRGPMAQLYGNSAGGVLQVVSKEPPRDGGPATAIFSAGAGSDTQRQAGLSVGGGNALIGATLDFSHYGTAGYRDHSSAERTQLAGKVVMRPSTDTTLTALFSQFGQDRAQDPLGLTAADYAKNPRQVIPAAISFDTRKAIAQLQGGLVLEQSLTPNDRLNARAYGGTRQVNQLLAQSGSAATSSGGVVDLDRAYGGSGVSWTHKASINGMPIAWTIGVEADQLQERRRGYVNNNGVAGDLRRDEDDSARNTDAYGQLDWTFAPQWRATAGLRMSRVRLAVDDHYITAASPNDSGAVDYRNTSPVAGLVWHAGDGINVYANLGRGFETPTLAEAAYRANGTGPNLGLLASTSTQAELGVKIREGRHALEFALFDARSDKEIVPLSVVNGRSVFQNVDGVRRRGSESSWQAKWDRLTTQFAWTWLAARFEKPFANAQNAVIAAGNALPGAPEHSLNLDAQVRFTREFSVGLALRAESRTWVNDLNSEAAAGFAVLNANGGYALRFGGTQLFLYGRVDNVLDRRYVGSVIVNDGNSRYYEAAPGRRFFAGLRAAL